MKFIVNCLFIFVMIITWKMDVPVLLSRWFCVLGPALAFAQANRVRPLFRMGTRLWGRVRCDVWNWNFSISLVGGRMGNANQHCFRRECPGFWMLYQAPPRRFCSRTLVWSASVRQRGSRATTCPLLAGSLQCLRWLLELDTRARQWNCSSFAAGRMPSSPAQSLPVLWCRACQGGCSLAWCLGEGSSCRGECWRRPAFRSWCFLFGPKEVASRV